MGHAVIEHFVEKLGTQPVVHVSDYVDPSEDSAGATGAVVVIDTQDGSPIDGDVPTFVSGTPNKFAPMPGGTAAMAPTFIASGATYRVPDNKQSLFAMTINNEGTIDIGDNAFLIMVD